MCWIFSSRKHNLRKMYLKAALGSVCEFPSSICLGSMGPWWLVSFKQQQQMRLPFHMQAIQSHMHSPGQANLIMNEVVIGSYTCVVDHSCSYPNEVCVSGFNIWWLVKRSCVACVVYQCNMSELWQLSTICEFVKKKKSCISTTVALNLSSEVAV